MLPLKGESQALTVQSVIMADAVMVTADDETLSGMKSFHEWQVQSLSAEKDARTSTENLEELITSAAVNVKSSYAAVRVSEDVGPARHFRLVKTDVEERGNRQVQKMRVFDRRT